MAFDIVGARKSGVPDSVIADHLANQRGFDIAGARKSGVPDSAVIDWMQNNPQDSSTAIERNVAPVVNAFAKLGQSSIGIMDLGAKGLDVAADYLSDGKVRIPTVTEGIKRTTGFDINEQIQKSEEAKNALIGAKRRQQSENVSNAFDESLLSGAASLKDNPDYVLTALEEQIPNLLTMPLALRNGVAKIFTAAGGGAAGAAAVKAALPTIAKKSAVLEGAMTAGSAAGEKSSDGLSNTETASALGQGAATTIGSLVANKLGAKYLGSGDLESKLATKGLSDVIESGEGIVNRAIAAGREALKSGAENALEEGLQNPLEQIPKSIEDGDTFGQYLDKAGRQAVEGAVVGGLSGGAAAGGASLLSDDSSRSKVSPDNKPVSDGNNPNMDMADLAMQEEDLRNELPRVNPENNVEPEVDANNKNHMDQDVVDPVRDDEDAKIVADAELRADADNASRKAKLLKLAADAEEKIYAKKYADGFANEEEKRGYVDRLVLAKRLAMEAKNRLDNLNTVIQKTTKNVDDGNVVDENKTNNQTQEQPIPPAYNDEVSAKDDEIGQGRAAGVLGYQSGAPRQLPESLANADPSVKRAWYHGWDMANSESSQQQAQPETNEQMQPRDRDKVTSVEQLTGIARKPDYDRVSQSKEEGANAGGSGGDRSSGGETFNLESYTNEEIAQREAAAQAAADAEAKAARDAENKASADAEVGQFTLTGSDRQADVAASAGQNDLFGVGSTRKSAEADSSQQFNPLKDDAGVEKTSNDKIADALKKAKAAGVKDIKKLKKTMLAKHPVDGVASSEVDISDAQESNNIINTSKKKYIAGLIKKNGIKKGSPGYDVAIKKLESAYDESLNKALAALPFEQFHDWSVKDGSKSETMNRRAWEALREEYGIEDVASSKAETDTDTKKETAKQAQPSTESSSNNSPVTNKIEDFGEKLEGKRQRAPSFVDEKHSKEGDDGNVALFSRNAEKNGDISDQVADDIITLYKELGSDESVFQYDKSVMDTIDETVFSVLPDGSKQEADDLTLEMAKEEAESKGHPEILDVRKYIIPVTEVVTDNKNRPILDKSGNKQYQKVKRSAYVYINKLGEMWVDLSELKKAGGIGGRIYSKVADFSHENGLTFTGDPIGLSDDAMLKRTEHMASGIARRKKTSQFAPHPRQVSPYVKDEKDSAELARIVRPLKWIKGNDRFNQREIIKTAYHNITKIMPELRHAWIDINDGRIYQGGSPIDTPFANWVRDIQAGKFNQDGQRRKSADGTVEGQRAPLDAFRGLFASASIKRQLLANTLAQYAGESEGKRRQVLDRLGAILPDLENLDGRKVFYQRSSDNGYKRGLRDEKEQTFASGLPRNLPVAETTASRTLENKLNGWRERQGLSGRVRIREVSPVSLPKQLNRALAGFTDATGTRVVLFRNLTPEVDDFNGVNFRDGTLYINENSQNPITLTAAHEWVHTLKQNNPESYQEIENEVRRQGRLDAWHERNITEEGFDRGRDHAIEELTAAAVSDALTDPVFLQKLAERDQSVFRRIAKDFLKFLKTLIDGWKDQGSNEYLQDVEAFRDKLARVLDELPVAKQKPGVIKALFLRVFHGTPHRGIENEGFKLNKIGSGEGSHNYVIWNEDLLTPEAAKIEPMYSREQSTKAPHEKQRASGKLDSVKEAIVRAKLAAKTKATLNKWVKKERGLTESDYAAYREGQGELHTINGILVPRLTSKMKKAWKLEYGTDNIMQDVRKAYELKKYLDGDKNAKLPDSIKSVADMMRAEIDLKSAQIVDIISDDIKHLSSVMDVDALDAANSFLNLSKSVSNSSMSREHSSKVLSEAVKKAINRVDDAVQKSFVSDFIAKSQQVDSILANKGKYMNRSYQAHNDPDWMSKIIDDRYSSAGDDYKKNIVNHKVYDLASKDILKGNPQATDKEIYTAIRQILQDASDVSNPMAAFGSSALIKKMGIFKGRKLDDMAGIRNLLGEYNNPVFAFANTMAKQTNIIASHKFLKGVRDNGLESGLFSTKQEGNYQREITGKGMSPLSGLYTTEQYYNTINDVLHKDKPESYISALLHVSALIKAGKTVLSPGTSILNFLSNASNAMSLGHWSPKAVAKTAKFFVDYSRGDKDAEALMDEAGRLGVISGSLFSHEVAKYIKEHHDVLANEKENIKRFMKPARMYVDAMTWFYEFGDNAWKINAYFNEIENGVGKTKAADIVANGYPNYSTVPKTVDMLKTVPFISDFPSFVWEQYRVSAHQLKWIADEYKDGNKAKALSAATRFIIARGLLPAAAYAISLANGWDYDEGEEYQQRMMAPWDKNGAFIFMPKDGKGNVSAFNIGRYSMYDTQVKVIKAIVAGEPVQAVKEALSGLASFEMWVDALYAAATGKTSSGALIYSESDTAGDKVKKGSEFLWTQLAPTVLSKNARDFTQSNADLINHTLEGTPLASMGVSGNAKGKNYSNKASALQLIGVRNQNMNASSSLKNKIIQNSITLRANQKTVRDLLGSQSYINNAQVADVVLDYLKQYDRANNRISEDARYLISSGVAEKNVVFEALKSANVSKENAARIVTGSPVRWKPSKDMVEYIKDQIFNSDLPADKKREYLSQRIKVMNQTINNHYAGKSK